VKQTLQVLKTISDKYAQPQYQDVVVGIQLLNEPLGPKLSFELTKQFYQAGFDQVRAVSDTLVILHDAFQTPGAWNNFLNPGQGAQNVALDHHEYQVFDTGLIAMQPQQHIQQVCAAAPSYTNGDKWTFVGEWTGAMTDCAKYLNGRGVGARYDGTYPGSSRVGDCGWQNDVSKWSQEYKDATRAYIETQMSVFEGRTQGWIWWNFKTEGASEWDAFALIDAGVFPQPLTDRKSQMMC
jgi:glucan 1,3-beta-glucosidase